MRRDAWGDTQELLAALLFELGELRQSFQMVHAKPGGRKPRDPYRYPRPDEREARRSAPATRAERYARIPVKQAGYQPTREEVNR